MLTTGLNLRRDCAVWSIGVYVELGESCMIAACAAAFLQNEANATPTAVEDKAATPTQRVGAEKDWISEGQSAQIKNFSPKDENLVLVWDDRDPASRKPKIAIRPDPLCPQDFQIWQGAQKLAQVTGPIPTGVGEITFLPLSTATALGFAPN